MNSRSSGLQSGGLVSLASPMLHSPEQTMTCNLRPPTTEGLAGSVAHTRNLSPRELCQKDCHESKSAWATRLAPGHPELERLYLQKQNEKNTEETFSILSPCWCPTFIVKAIGDRSQVSTNGKGSVVYTAINQPTLALLLKYTIHTVSA